MAIPPKIRTYGDKNACHALMGVAKQQMAFTLEQAAFQRLEVYRTEKTPYPGAEIRCIKRFNETEIIIDAQPKPDGHYYEEWQECYCFPHFSMGIIRKVTPENPTAAELATVRFKYDVDICAKTTYTLKEDVYSAGWERYYIGQYVLVSIGAKLNKPPRADFDTDRNCLMQQPRFDTLVVSPLHIFRGMKKWGKQMQKVIDV